jgi:hypothetical protein
MNEKQRAMLLDHLFQNGYELGARMLESETLSRVLGPEGLAVFERGMRRGAAAYLAAEDEARAGAAIQAAPAAGKKVFQPTSDSRKVLVVRCWA